MLNKDNKCTIAHKGHAANKKGSLQTKNERCKQKRKPMQAKTGTVANKKATTAKTRRGTAECWCPLQ